MGLVFLVFPGHKNLLARSLSAALAYVHVVFPHTLWGRNDNIPPSSKLAGTQPCAVPSHLPLLLSSVVLALAAVTPAPPAPPAAAADSIPRAAGQSVPR